MSEPQSTTHVIGIDIGGTRVRMGVVDPLGQADDVSTFSTRTFRDATAILDAIGEAAYEKIKRHRNIIGIGLAIPGVFDEEAKGPSLISNVACLRHVDLREPLESRLEMPVILETDANAAALAEFRLGAGKGSKRLLVGSIGTGVGVGVILKGQLAKHTSGTGGSLGHLVIDADGPECGCGGKGCIEALASGRALLARLSINPNDMNDQIWDEIMMRQKQGDSEVANAVESIGRSLGVGVAGWLALYQPDRVVLRGGVTALGPTWLDAVKAGMLNVGSPYYTKSVSICLGELGDNAGFIGAGLRYFDKMAGQSSRL